MTRNEPKSPILFNEKSSDSLSSVVSDISDMSTKVNIKGQVMPNIGDLFAKLNKESEIKSELSVTDSMTSFLKWTADHNKKLRK